MKVLVLLGCCFLTLSASAQNFTSPTQSTNLTASTSSSSFASTERLMTSSTSSQSENATTSTGSTSTSSVTSTQATTESLKGPQLTNVVAQGNCGALKPYVEGNTIHLMGATLHAGGQPINCTLNITVKNGASLQSLEVLHSGEVHLARKYKATCYVYPNTNTCSSAAWVTPSAQRWTAQFSASYVGCGINSSSSQIFDPSEDQTVWHSNYAVRKSFFTSCQDTDTITIILGHSLTEKGAIPDTDYGYNGNDSYIAEYSMNFNKNAPVVNSSSSLGLSYVPSVLSMIAVLHTLASQ